MHLERVDLGDRDTLVPDVLRFQDQLTDRPALLAAANRVLTGDSDIAPALEIELPKSPYFTRTALMPALVDRIAYQAAVAAVADVVERTLTENVYGGRVATSGPDFLKDGLAQWKQWRDRVMKDIASGSHWMVKTDATAYFDTIQHGQVLSSLEALAPTSIAVPALRRMLRAWALAPGQGIPQGPNASRFLQNVYFSPIDQEMVSEQWHYYRYIDDIRILASTKHHAIEGLRTLERACKRRALFLSAQKTQLLHGRDALGDWLDDAEIERAQYLMDEWKHTEARSVLVRILKRSLQREGQLKRRAARFSLYRLLLLRDREPLTLVLAKLDDLAPVAPLVALYLVPWLTRPRVRERLADFLEDRERNVFPYLAAWILAALADQTGPPTGRILAYCRSTAHDKNAPTYLRVIAATVLGHGNQVHDVEWLRQEARREYDPRLVRGYLVALGRAGRLDAGTALRARSNVPSVDRTLAYLAGRRDFPSLLTARKRVKRA